MRVAILSTIDAQGGAARAAYRLHQGLRLAGAESSMIVQRKTLSDCTVLAVPPPGGAHSLFWQHIQCATIDRNRTPLSDTFFSLGLPGTDVSQHPAVQEAEVINLHWVAGFQSAADVARLAALGKPVVWTLHDQRAFTGGCHYSAGCRAFTDTCRPCPQLRDDPLSLPAVLLADARELLNRLAITVVAPSRWLAGLARESALFGPARIETIPYALETDLYRPKPKKEARQALGLQPNGVFILFGADNGAERRKGFHHLLAALRTCLEDASFRTKAAAGQIVVLCFGRPAAEVTALPVTVRSLGYLSSDQAVAAAYAAADFFALPSLEDNLPCTLLESMSCGTPVVAFDTGGIPEALVDGVNGRLAPVGDTTQLARAMLALCADPALREQLGREARRGIEADHTLPTQAQRYLALFEELVAATPRPTARPSPPPEQFSGPRLEAILPELIEYSAQAFQAENPKSGRRKRLLRRVRRRLAGARAKRTPLPKLLAELHQDYEKFRVPWFRRVRETWRNRLGFDAPPKDPVGDT